MFGLDYSLGYLYKMLLAQHSTLLLNMSTRRTLRDVPERRAAAAATGRPDPTARVKTRPSLPARHQPVLLASDNETGSVIAHNQFA